MPTSIERLTWLALPAFPAVIVTSMIVKKRKVTILVPLLAGLGFLTYFLYKPNTLEANGKQLASCIVEEDMRCIALYLTEEDLRHYGLERSEALSMLQAVLRVRRNRAQYTGSPAKLTLMAASSNDRGKQDGICNVVVPLKAPTTDSNWGFITSKTGNGIQSPQLITSLLVSFISDEVVPATSNPKFSKLHRMIKFAQRTGPELSEIGFKGVWRDDLSQILTWEEYAERYKSVLLKSPEGKIELALIDASR
jgi:hypothetical protein